ILGPHIGVITPNVPEAEALTGVRIADRASMQAAAEAVRDLLGGAAVLLKGGHLAGAEAVDLLVTDRGVIELRGELVALDRPVHGTGCALSTALACNLAAGMDVVDASRAAKQLVAGRLRAPERPGRGSPSL